MTTTKITGAEAAFKCPHCGEELECPVGDFVIPGHVGERSIAREYSDCGNCDGIFSVEKTAEDQFEVTPIEGKYGDHRP